ncbi:MAG TPA: flagellar basal-body rod protein FlgF, partial [Micavibrio sp.]
MENSIYVGLSRAVALERDMDTVANNIANVDTPGYRGQYMMFKEYVEKPKGIEDPLSMVLDYGQYMSNKPGSLQQTGNQTDFALSGPGFFGVQNNGETMYTRAGNFAVNVAGELVTAEGKQVVNDGGSPMIIPADTTELHMAQDGTLSNQNGPIGKLMVKEFANINDLDPVGDTLYQTKAAALEPKETHVVQGALEGSNVNSIMEMTHMIDVHR